jgi:hypothetical protein
MPISSKKVVRRVSNKDLVKKVRDIVPPAKRKGELGDVIILVTFSLVDILFVEISEVDEAVSMPISFDMEIISGTEGGCGFSD